MTSEWWTQQSGSGDSSSRKRQGEMWLLWTHTCPNKLLTNMHWDYVLFTCDWSCTLNVCCKLPIVSTKCQLCVSLHKAKRFYTVLCVHLGDVVGNISYFQSVAQLQPKFRKIVLIIINYILITIKRGPLMNHRVYSSTMFVGLPIFGEDILNHGREITAESFWLQ